MSNKGSGRAAGDVKTEEEGKIKQGTGAAQHVYLQAKKPPGDAMGKRKSPPAMGKVGAGTRRAAQEFLPNAIES